MADLAPVEDAAVFFGSSGGEAVDTAANIARRYCARRRAERTAVVLQISPPFVVTERELEQIAGVVSSALCGVVGTDAA